MRLSARIQHLQAQEVAAVADALVAARQALADADDQQAAYFGARSGGGDWLSELAQKTKDPGAGRDDVASWNLRDLRRAFEASEALLQGWLRDGAERFYPAVEAWDAGDDSLAETLSEQVAERQRRLAAYEASLPELRSRLMFVPPVREAAQRLFKAVEAVQRVEDIEVIPAILSGKRTTTSQPLGRRAERYKTSDDVARSLRQARPSRPAPEPEPTGLLASIKKLFGR